jgi:hypothetical protein
MISTLSKLFQKTKSSKLPKLQKSIRRLFARIPDAFLSPEKIEVPIAVKGQVPSSPCYNAPYTY